MTTLTHDSPTPVAGNERFFLKAAIAMTLVIVVGFSLQLVMGRSTFASPPVVHAHALVFMGWVVIYVLQNVFVATNRMSLHRPLGWIATAWIFPMLILGCWVTVAMARRGQVPFFFQPLHFLVFDPVSLFAFAGLTASAVGMRRRTEWHRRLHLCGMSMLLGPGFGRLIPMPLLLPWAWEATFALSMIFPAIGILSDIRRCGRAHPAWRWGVGAMLASFLLIELVTYSPLGAALYRAVTAESPGAAVAPLEFALPPQGALVTGRT